MILLPASVRTVQPCIAHVICGAAAGRLLRFTDSDLQDRRHHKFSGAPSEFLQIPPSTASLRAEGLHARGLHAGSYSLFV